MALRALSPSAAALPCAEPPSSSAAPPNAAMAAAARVLVARGAAAPRPGAFPPPRPGTAPDASPDATPGATPLPLSVATTGPLGQGLGQNLPLAALAELAPRTWGDEELRQLAQREVQQEREVLEEVRQTATARQAAVAAAIFLGQHSTPAGAARQAAGMAATATKFEHLVVRSAAAQRTISRALAKGDATAAVRTAAAAKSTAAAVAPCTKAAPLGRATEDSVQGAEGSGSVGVTSWKIASTSRKASCSMGNLAAAARASEAREEAAGVRDLTQALAESKLLQAGGKGWEAMRVQAVEVGATMRLVGQLARRGKFGAICAMGGGAARRRMGPYATKFANTMRAEHTICSFIYPLAKDTSVVTDPQVVQIFWNGLMTEVMMTAFLMSAEPDDGASLSPTRLIILAVIGAGTLVAMAMLNRAIFRWGNRGRRFQRGARELKGANRKLEPVDRKPDGHEASHRRSSWTGVKLGVRDPNPSSKPTSPNNPYASPNPIYTSPILFNPRQV